MTNLTPAMIAEGERLLPLSCAPLDVAQATALFAPALAVRLDVEVAPRKLMPVLAMGLGGVSGRKTNAAHGVDLDGDKLKVVRPNAARVAAQMVDDHPGWQRPHKKRVCDAMGPEIQRPNTEGAVTGFMARFMACPNPAPVRLRDEPLEKALRNRLAVGGVDGQTPRSHRAALHGSMIRVGSSVCTALRPAIYTTHFERAEP
jgi:hypothetical protein